MLKLENIYTETKHLNELFSQQYDIKSPEIIRKYKLELLVEFGELANETRCFKFWSKRQKGDKEKKSEQTRKGACFIEFENNPNFEKSNF